MQEKLYVACFKIVLFLFVGVVYVYGYECPSLHVWKSEVDIKCPHLFLCFINYFWRLGLSPNIELTISDWAYLSLQCWGHGFTLPGFYALGIWTQVLVFAQQAFYFPFFSLVKLVSLLPKPKLWLQRWPMNVELFETQQLSVNMVARSYNYETLLCPLL